jgi:hypothetical protein
LFAYFTVAPMAGMLSNRNEDESSQQTASNNSNSNSEFVNCPQCHLEFNNPQVKSLLFF